MFDNIEQNYLGKTAYEIEVMQHVHFIHLCFDFLSINITLFHE